MGKKDPQIVRGDVITGGTKVDPQTTGNIVQPLSAQVNALSATSTPQGETDWAAAYRDRQKEAETKSAATLAQQSYWDMQKQAALSSASNPNTTDGGTSCLRTTPEMRNFGSTWRCTRRIWKIC